MSMLGNLSRSEDSAAPKRIVFQPNLATRATAETMRVAAQLAADVDHAFGSLTTTGLSTATHDDCGPWRRYCGALVEAVEHVLARGKRAVVITQPLLSDLHLEQQTALAAMVRQRFGGNPRVRYVDLSRLIDMRDTTLVYDGLHLVPRGNEMIAEALVPSVAQLIR